MRFFVRFLRTQNDNRIVVNSVASHSSGQSLIETIVAIFVLTTGLAAGLALAIFVFGASSDIIKRITATGLAREGAEVVRRMRDSNWLEDTLTNCSGQQCFSEWLEKTYDIEGTPSGKDYRMVFDPTSNSSKWDLDSGTDYRLYLQPSNQGYNHNTSGSATNFFRKITIILQDTNSPYSATSPLLLVRSSVWWHGKNCPSITNLTNPSQTPCKIIIEENLTNWKNY